MLNRLIRLATAVAAFVFATTAFADHSWNNYHWARTTNSFTLQYVDSVNSVWDSALAQSIQKWGQSNVLDFAVAGMDDSDRTRKRCPMITGQMRVCNAAYGQNGWLGLASIGLDTRATLTKAPPR